MILALKLCLTPLLIAAVTLVGRRWGPGVSGWMLGFPLTSGPISFILAWQYGNVFAAHSALGTMVGIGSVCLFCLAYSVAAKKLAWPVCAVISLAVFLISTFAWNSFKLTLLPSLALLLILILLSIRLIPQKALSNGAVKAPGWDIPARMLIATLFVLLLTTFANSLGAQLSGLLSPFPIFGLVLTVFAHRQLGGQAAISLLHGLALGALGFTSFFLVVVLALPALGIGWAYLLAVLTVLAVNGISLRLA